MLSDYNVNQSKYANIEIEGDVSSQQAIRYCLAQLEKELSSTNNQCYTAMRWETEITLIPFLLANNRSDLAKQFLLERHSQLNQAKDFAKILGFSNGAALYPFLSIHGKEGIQDINLIAQGIFRNGFIIYALNEYINQTTDKSFLISHGVEIIIAVNRFWVQRVHYSNLKQRFVFHGVTGPNEYELNKNNNWFTSYLVKWCLNYGCKIIESIDNDDHEFIKLISRNHFKTDELEFWKNVANHLYLPEEKSLHIFLQQDDYLDKEQHTIADLTESDLPLNKSWSPDRIQRSSFIQQADVLLGIYLFESDFSVETIRKQFEFYEARTVHESLLSYSIHIILACSLNKLPKATELFKKALNSISIENPASETSSLNTCFNASLWMSIVYGFAGLRIRQDVIVLNPLLPEQWKAFSFNFQFRSHQLNIKILATRAEIENRSNSEVNVNYKNKQYIIPSGRRMQLS